MMLKIYWTKHSLPHNSYRVWLEGWAPDQFDIFGKQDFEDLKRLSHTHPGLFTLVHWVEGE